MKLFMVFFMLFFANITFAEREIIDPFGDTLPNLAPCQSANFDISYCCAVLSENLETRRVQLEQCLNLSNNTLNIIIDYPSYKTNINLDIYMYNFHSTVIGNIARDDLFKWLYIRSNNYYFIEYNNLYGWIEITESVVLTYENTE